MKAVIMAGGKGTRLQPLTADIPKPLVPVLNRPIIAYSIALLRRYNIHDIALTLSYMPDKIIDALQNESGRGEDYTLYYFIERQPLGTAGSVRNTGKFLDETFIVVSGDALTNLNVEKMLSFHRGSGADVTIAAAQVDDPSQFGVICRDSVGRVFGFKEKPPREECPGNLVSSGIYIIEPRVLGLIPEGAQFDFARDLFPLMLDKGMKIYSYVMDDYWCDVGNISSYFSANMAMLRGEISFVNAESKMQNAELRGDIFPPAIKYEPPLCIGVNCCFGESAELRGGVIIGNDVSVGSDCVIKNSIILDGSQIPAHSKLTGVIYSPHFNVRVPSGETAAPVLPPNILPFKSTAVIPAT